MQGTTAMYESTTGAEVYDSAMRDFILGMNMYGLLVIIIIGIIGNAIASLVFLLSQHLKHQSNSVYLAFLNLCDLLFLLCLLISHLEWYNVFLTRQQGICQLVVYISYVSAFLSVWTVACFTMERFVVVYFPLKKMAYCTRGRAVKILLSFVLFGVLAYAYVFWTTSAQKFPYADHMQCMVNKEHEALVGAMTWVDTVLTMILPTLIIVTFNVLISYKIRQYLLKRRRNSAGTGESRISYSDTKVELNPLTMSTRSSSPFSSYKEKLAARLSPSQHVRRQVQGRATDRHQLRTTQTLLMISTLFVLLNFPSHAFRIWATVHPQGNLPPEWLLLLQLVFQFLYYLNFSCNLLIYCLCHRTFRKVVCDLIRTMCGSMRRSIQNV